MSRIPNALAQAGAAAVWPSQASAPGHVQERALARLCVRRVHHDGSRCRGGGCARPERARWPKDHSGAVAPQGKCGPWSRRWQRHRRRCRPDDPPRWRQRVRAAGGPFGRNDDGRERCRRRRTVPRRQVSSRLSSDAGGGAAPIEQTRAPMHACKRPHPPRQSVRGARRPPPRNESGRVSGNVNKKQI